MNERTYLKLMSALNNELARARNAEPYDPDAYNNVLDDMNETRARYNRSLLIKHWITLAVWILVVLLLLWLIFFGRNHHEL